MQTPKEAGFSMPAEWHPHSGCWMAWPCHMATWDTIGLERAREAYARVAHAIQKFEPVTMLVNPGDDRICLPLLGIENNSFNKNNLWFCLFSQVQ